MGWAANTEVRDACRRRTRLSQTGKKFLFIRALARHAWRLGRQQDTDFRNKVRELERKCARKNARKCAIALRYC
jgi:hypothetical protein